LIAIDQISPLLLLLLSRQVKLTPGTLKKGKAARQCMEALTRLPECLPREFELMRSAPEADAINAMVGTVKISMPGLQQLKANQKKAKKAAAQAKSSRG
jgi:hypothetical protein